MVSKLSVIVHLLLYACTSNTLIVWFIFVSLCSGQQLSSAKDHTGPVKDVKWLTPTGK